MLLIILSIGRLSLPKLWSTEKETIKQCNKVVKTCLVLILAKKYFRVVNRFSEFGAVLIPNFQRNTNDKNVNAYNTKCVLKWRNILLSSCAFLIDVCVCAHDETHYTEGHFNRSVLKSNDLSLTSELLCESTFEHFDLIIIDGPTLTKLFTTYTHRSILCY